MSKYNERETVIIRPDLSREHAGRVGLNHNMMTFAGKFVTIQNRHRKNYRIKEDNGNYVWYEDMIIPVDENKLFELLIKDKISEQIYETTMELIKRAKERL